MRNLTFYNAVNAINQAWDWGWTYKSLNINNCTIGLNMTNLNGTRTGQSVGSVTLIDSSISNTQIGIATSHDLNSQPPTAGSLILENVQVNNVPVIVSGPGGSTSLGGTTGTTTVAAWGQGHSYTPNGPTNFEGPITPFDRPGSLLEGGGKFYERSKPQYGSYPVYQFLSVRSAGATGDGITDDTATLQRVINIAAARNQIVFFDFGIYKVTKTLYIPSNSKIVGETYPVILSSGDFFANMNNSQPVVRVGLPGEVGSIEWSDMIVSTLGHQAGAVLFEINLAASSSNPTGIWDVHARIGRSGSSRCANDMVTDRFTRWLYRLESSGRSMSYHTQHHHYASIGEHELHRSIPDDARNQIRYRTLPRECMAMDCWSWLGWCDQVPLSSRSPKIITHSSSAHKSPSILAVAYSLRVNRVQCGCKILLSLRESNLADLVYQCRHGSRAPLPLPVPVRQYPQCIRRADPDRDSVSFFSSYLWLVRTKPASACYCEMAQHLCCVRPVASSVYAYYVESADSSAASIALPSLSLFMFISSTKNIPVCWIVPSRRYYQPNPNATIPFPPVASLNDPDFAVSCRNISGNSADGWGLRTVNSQSILIYGAGLYSFFNNYSTCKLSLLSQSRTSPHYFSLYSYTLPSEAA